MLQGNWLEILIREASPSHNESAFFAIHIFESATELSAEIVYGKGSSHAPSRKEGSLDVIEAGVRLSSCKEGLYENFD
jgi:hypothetical protein